MNETALIDGGKIEIIMDNPSQTDNTGHRQSCQPIAIDLFCGAGGATQGLTEAGYRVIGAVEFNPRAAETYRLNHPQVKIWEQDITAVPAEAMRRTLGLMPGQLDLLKTCPPCQGFSTLAEGRIGKDDPRNELVSHTIRFVRAFRPRAVMLENVPGLARDRRSTELMEKLELLGYISMFYSVNAADFNVPQVRKRVIMLAYRGRSMSLPKSLEPERGSIKPATVRAAFREMNESANPGDDLNKVRVLPPRILERVKKIPPEGNRFDLPVNLQLDCHKRMAGEGKKGASGSYARLKWDRPAPTMTTRCTTPACGPFLHPEEDRPLTLREAAVLQTFPMGYQFVGGRGEIERQIGNAVPVRMASAIAKRVLEETIMKGARS